MSLEELTEKKTSAQYLRDEIVSYFSSLDTISADDAKKSQEFQVMLNRHIDGYDHQIEKAVTNLRKGKW